MNGEWMVGDMYPHTLFAFQYPRDSAHVIDR